MSRDLPTTPKQWEIMRAVLAQADAGVFPSYAELNDMVTFGRPGATVAQIRGTIKHQVLQMKRRGYLEIVYEKLKAGRLARIKPTPAAYVKFRTGSS